ncbi:MAG: PLD nuclease N-terminal domain-containing protein [Bifidobacteriaceae bacterium]|nr:PLD nuclease N-terminal domain-containing protein [Bifidobacteriaceae bacterium]
MRVIFLYVIPLALMVYALVDCAQDDQIERTSIPKPAWMLLIIAIIYFGPIAWLVVSKIARPRTGGTPRPPVFPHRGGGRSVAPDDDPDFLRKLDEEQRKRRREGGQSGKDGSVK